MFSKINCIKILLLLLTLMLLSSCGLLANKNDSPEVISFQKGELVSKIRQELSKIAEASKAVAQESQFIIKADRADTFSAVLKCEDAQQRKIEIVLEKETEKLTRIRIRVGLLGDAELSTKLFEEIRKKSSSR
jgi:hypothetical protein